MFFFACVSRLLGYCLCSRVYNIEKILNTNRMHSPRHALAVLGIHVGFSIARSKESSVCMCSQDFGLNHGRTSGLVSCSPEEPWSGRGLARTPTFSWVNSGIASGRYRTLFALRHAIDDLWTGLRISYIPKSAGGADFGRHLGLGMWLHSGRLQEREKSTATLTRHQCWVNIDHAVSELGHCSSRSHHKDLIGCL